MASRSLISLTLAAIVAAGAVAWWSLRVPAAAAVTAQSAPLVRTLEFSARVATASRVEIGSTLTGRVADIAVSEGQRVQAGDVLVRLEDEELRAAWAQAQAGERQAQARLAGLRSSGRGVAQAGAAQAESVLVAAQAELERTQALVDRGFLGAARLDEARRAVAVAQAQLDGARALQAANAERGTDVAQAEAQLALARSTTAAAAARLAQAELRAPADAMVLARSVEPGQIVQPGRVLLILALATPTELVAQVDERHLEQLQVGQAARAVADAYPERPFDATVRAISPLVDAQRGAVEVKFSLPGEAPAFLREDMTLSVSVETARREQAIVVPTLAVRTDDAGRRYVLVAPDGQVQVRAVQTGLHTLEATEITDGLAPGETVLVGAAPAPGKRVRVDTSLPLPAGAGGGAREDAASAVTGAMGR